MLDDPLLETAGVALVDDRQARWCLWAPKARRVDLILDPDGAGRRIAATPLSRGYFEAITETTGEGQEYAYSLDGGPPIADPASRWQPRGIQGPSATVFPDKWRWNDAWWKGIPRTDLVLYELHVGTFTPEGTFAAIGPRLDALRTLGVTAIELMPVGQFPGDRGWGYDVAFPFAPQHSYGGPQGLRWLIEACHLAGLAVVLDVVWNHFGPEGVVLGQCGPYFHDRYRNAWGQALNFDGPHCDPVRRLALDNIRMWVRDYRVDGLRLDAADQIFDRSPRSIVAEMGEAAHQEAARRGFPCHVFAETDLNDAPRFLGPTERGGYALDGQWNDDFHHATHVVMTGDASGYFQDFADGGGAAALAKVLAGVFQNDGVYSRFRDRRHGTRAEGLCGDRFIAFIQNHDQVANACAGRRLARLVTPAQCRLAAGLLLLSPRLPLLFMGEEYGETRDFPFFCDYHDPGLVAAVRRGRAEEFAAFGNRDEPPDPIAAATRDDAVLSWAWRDDPQRDRLRRLYADLMKLRRTRAGLRDKGRPEIRRVGTVLEMTRGDTRIVFNLGAEGVRIDPPFDPAALLYRSEVDGADRDDSPLLGYEFIVLDQGEPR